MKSFFQMHDPTRATWQPCCAAVIEKGYRFNLTERTYFRTSVVLNHIHMPRKLWPSHSFIPIDTLSQTVFINLLPLQLAILYEYVNSNDIYELYNSLLTSLTSDFVIVKHHCHENQAAWITSDIIT